MDVIASTTAIVAAIIAAGALYFSAVSAKAARRSANQALEQTRIQRQVQIDASQPYVWVDIRPDESVGTLLNLWIGNSGPTVATNVRIGMDQPLPHIAELTDSAAAATELLANGLASLPPGRTYAWILGQGFNLLEGSPPRIRFTVNANGPSGPVPELSYIVDLAALPETLDRPQGSLHELTSAVKEIGKKIR